MNTIIRTVAAPDSEDQPPSEVLPEHTEKIAEKPAEESAESAQSPVQPPKKARPSKAECKRLMEQLDKQRRMRQLGKEVPTTSSNAPGSDAAPKTRKNRPVMLPTRTKIMSDIYDLMGCYSKSKRMTLDETMRQDLFRKQHAPIDFDTVNGLVEFAEKIKQQKEREGTTRNSAKAKANDTAKEVPVPAADPSAAVSEKGLMTVASDASARARQPKKTSHKFDDLDTAPATPLPDISNSPATAESDTPTIDTARLRLSHIIPVSISPRPAIDETTNHEDDTHTARLSNSPVPDSLSPRPTIDEKNYDDIPARLGEQPALNISPRPAIVEIKEVTPARLGEQPALNISPRPAIDEIKEDTTARLDQSLTSDIIPFDNFEDVLSAPEMPQAQGPSMREELKMQPVADSAPAQLETDKGTDVWKAEEESDSVMKAREDEKASKAVNMEWNGSLPDTSSLNSFVFSPLQISDADNGVEREVETHVSGTSLTMSAEEADVLPLHTPTPGSV